MTPETVARFLPALDEWDSARTEAMALAGTGSKEGAIAYARLADAEAVLAALAREVRRTRDREESLSVALSN